MMTIYDKTLVETLYKKSLEYNDKVVVAFSGAQLHSKFRQICHSNPSLINVRHCLYYHGPVQWNEDSSDIKVDVVQGFAGVFLPSLDMFNVSEFTQMLGISTTQQPAAYNFKTNMTTSTSWPSSLPRIVYSADDYLISGYLEYRNISKYVVTGGVYPKLIKESASQNALSNGMHNKVIATSYILQQTWNIWNQHTFINPYNLTKRQQQLIDCEANNRDACPPGMSKENVSQLLDKELNVE